jgi:HEAT repeat protein
MRPRWILILLAAVLLVVVFATTEGILDRAPERPAEEPADGSPDEPPPPSFGEPTAPVFLPPDTLARAAADAEQAGTPADPLARAGAAVLGRLGPLLAEVNDPEAFLAAAGSSDWSMMAVPREITDRVLDALKSDDAKMRLNAALTLSAIQLTPDDLGLIRTAFDAEIATMKGDGEKNAVLGMAFALSKHGDRHGTAALGDALRTGSGDALDGFRGGATLVLAITGEPESSAVLRELAATDPDRAVRKTAVVGLGRIGGDENRTALAESLAREQDIEVRAWSALAAGRATPKGGDDGTLAGAVATDRDGEVRAAAAYALGKAGGKGTVETLTTSFYGESHSLAKVGAVAGLARRPKAAEFVEGYGTPWLAETVRSDPDSTARYYGVATFEMLPASKARTEAIRHAAGHDRSSWVRGRAVRALVRTEGKDAVPFLRKAMETETSKRVKSQMERAIRKLSK